MLVSYRHRPRGVHPISFLTFRNSRFSLVSTDLRAAAARPRSRLRDVGNRYEF